MMCQKCGKRAATVHYKQIINGAVSEEYLCSECASAHGSGLHFSMEKSADELFGNLFSGTSVFSGIGGAVCSLCGSTARDISVSGKVGCAKCYEIFRNDLKKRVTRIHGNVHHVGRAPGKHRETMERHAHLEALRAEQHKAIEDQKFELAAELRDKINALMDEERAEKGDK